MECPILQRMLRLVLDTAVVTAAFRSRLGASNLLLQAVARRRAWWPWSRRRCFWSTRTCWAERSSEWRPGWTRRRRPRALAALAAVLVPVEVHFRWRPQLRDPADELVLEAAINGRADAIVTFNLRDFAGRVERFGVIALPPAAALARIKT